MSGMQTTILGTYEVPDSTTEFHAKLIPSKEVACSIYVVHNAETSTSSKSEWSNPLNMSRAGQFYGELEVYDPVSVDVTLKYEENDGDTVSLDTLDTRLVTLAQYERVWWDLRPGTARFGTDKP